MSEYASEPWEPDPQNPHMIKSKFCPIDGDMSQRWPVVVMPGIHASMTRLRIIVCVNACEGIPIEALDKGVIPALLEACTDVLDDLETQVKRTAIDTTRTQLESSADKLRAAIALAEPEKVKGGG